MCLDGVVVDGVGGWCGGSGGDEGDDGLRLSHNHHHQDIIKAEPEMAPTRLDEMKPLKRVKEAMPESRSKTGKKTGGNSLIWEHRLSFYAAWYTACGRADGLAQTV